MKYLGYWSLICILHIAFLIVLIIIWFISPDLLKTQINLQSTCISIEFWYFQYIWSAWSSKKKIPVSSICPVTDLILQIYSELIVSRFDNLVDVVISLDEKKILFQINQIKTKRTFYSTKRQHIFVFTICFWKYITVPK